MYAYWLEPFSMQKILGILSKSQIIRKTLLNAMATSKESTKNRRYSEALYFIQEYPRKLTDEVDSKIQRLNTAMAIFEKDSKSAYSVLPKTVDLARVFGLPNISSKFAKSLLMVFRHAGETCIKPQSDTHNPFDRLVQVPKISRSDDTRKHVFGVVRKLTDSLRCLVSLSEGNIESKSIQTACAEVPLTCNGSEVLSLLKAEIEHLREQEKPSTSSEDTEARFKDKVYYLDLYFNFQSLWEFVLHYLVILCIAEGNSQVTAAGYFELIEGQLLERESTLKFLFEPEDKYAGVAAVFRNSELPILKTHMENSLSSQLEYFHSLNGRKVKIVSLGQQSYAMFRHPTEKIQPFKRKRFVRVSKKQHTLFYLDFIKETNFVIRMDTNRELTLKINRKGNLVTDKPGKYDKTDQSDMSAAKGEFNLVRLGNSNVMISCRRYPTCFIAMTSAKEDAFLETKNIGTGLNSQWKLEILG